MSRMIATASAAVAVKHVGTAWARCQVIKLEKEFAVPESRRNGLALRAYLAFKLES